VVDIEQQIAHLRWLRQQNERSIRQTIESSKILKQKDTILGLSVDQTTEKNMWTTKVVKDELTRPLVINDEELFQIQYDENRIKLRLHKYARQQLENVEKQLETKESWQVKTVQGIQIKAQQIHNLKDIKQRLQGTIAQIEERVPYIDVKAPIPKLF